MPVFVGGAIALLGRTGRRSQPDYEYDRAEDGEMPEYWKMSMHFIEQKELIQTHLKCTVKLFEGVIPPSGGKMEGILILEASKDVKHTGLFLLLKGLPLQGKKKQRQERGNMKFTVLGSVEGEEAFLVERGSRETYQLELDIKEGLPLPIITGDGKLAYRLQAWVTATAYAKERRHIWLGDTMLRWMGRRVVTGEERGRRLTLEQKVESRRSLMGLGRRKVAEVEWRVNRAGIVVGEGLEVELWGKTREKGGMEVEWNVELAQKVWYQMPEGGRMVVLMKINRVWMEESRAVIEEEDKEGNKAKVWRGRFKVPRKLTPSCSWDFANSVGYVLRFKIGFGGESKEGWSGGELPVVIGTSREIVEGEEQEEEEDDDGGNEQGGSSRVSPVPEGACGGTGLKAEESVGCPRRSRSMNFLPNLPYHPESRRESINSMYSTHSYASTLTVSSGSTRLPPSYSQLSSRRPTLETLPPSYYELEMQQRGLLSPYDEHPDNANASTRSSPGLPHITLNQPSNQDN